MKKISLALCVALIVGGGLFTSCDDETEDAIEDILAPSEKWYLYEMTNKDDTSSAQIYMYYSDEAKAVKDGFSMKGRDDLGDDSNVGGGLTLLIVGNSDKDFLGVAKDKFTIKTISKNDEASKIFNDDEKTEDKNNKLSVLKDTKNTWMLIYQALSKKKDENGKKILEPCNSSLPYPLLYDARKNITPATSENLKESFSWKKILLNYLLAE